MALVQTLAKSLDLVGVHKHGRHRGEKTIDNTCQPHCTVYTVLYVLNCNVFSLHTDSTTQDSANLGLGFANSQKCTIFCSNKSL